MTKLVSVIAAAAIISALAHAASARDTGWINGFEWLRIAKTLEKNGEMPVSVECKDSKSRGLSFTSGVANVRIEKNPGNIAWAWAFGDRVQRAKQRYAARGYKMVSYSEYRRASGLTIPCAIWHKEN